MNKKKKQKLTLDKEAQQQAKEAKNLIAEGKAIYDRALTHQQFLQAQQIFNKVINKSASIQIMHLNHVYHYRGLCYLKTKQLEKAQKDFFEAISISDDKSKNQFYNSLGKCKIEMSTEENCYLEEAIKYFQKSLEYSHNNDPQAYFYLGIIYGKLHENYKAIQQYTKSLELLKGSDQFQTLIERGLCYRKIGRMDSSIQDLLKASEIKKRNPNVHFNLGFNYLKIQKYELAIQRFNIAIELDPIQPKFYNFKGLALFESGQQEMSLGIFKQAIKLYQSQNSSTVQAGQCWYNTGNAQLSLGKQTEALNNFMKAEEYVKDPEIRIKIYYGYGRAYEQLGDSKSIDKFQKCLELLGQNKENQLYLSCLYHLGINYHKNKKLESSINCFTKILNMDCSNRCVYEARARAYIDAEKYQKALEDLTAVAAFDNNYPQVHYLKGIVKTNLGQINQAVSDFFNAISLGSRNMYVFNGISYAYLLGNKFEKALIYSNISLEKQPKNQQFLIQRSRIFLQLFQNEKAISDLTKALNVNSRNPKILYRRGLAYYKNKEFIKAIEDLQSALKFDCVDKIKADIYYHLGIAYSNLEQFSETIQPFSKAIQIEERPKFYHERAKSYILLDENTKALQDLNKVIAAQPENAFAYFRRGLAHKNIRLYEEAAQDFSKAKEISPDDPRLTINKKQIYQMKYRKLCQPGQQQ